MDTLIQVCMVVLCVATIGLHVVRKNVNEAKLYAIQSLAIVSMLAVSLWERGSLALLGITLATLVVKVILAPIFFNRLVKRHQLKFAASTYANIPETVVVLILIFVLVSSSIFDPLTTLVSHHHGHFVLALSAMLGSIFLMVNRKGALSQVVGVLSVENCIVAFAVLAGLEQSAALQAGVIFDIFLWLIIASVMVSMVYRHTGSLDVTNLKKLRH